jgi:hypothetical protein
MDKVYNPPPEIPMPERHTKILAFPAFRAPSNGVTGGAARLLAALLMLTLTATACAAADDSGAESTRAAQTIARMITDVAFQKTSAPSPSPTAYTAPETAATATTGPARTPSEIATVELSTPDPRLSRSTYSGSTPTTDPVSLQTRTLTSHENAAFFVGATGNSAVAAGSNFTLTLIIRNVGSNTWYPSYLIYWHSGARMEAPAYIFFPEVTAPNQTLFLAVNLKAPENPKTYYQRWYFRDPYDTQFGIGPNFNEWLVVNIEVV